MERTVCVNDECEFYNQEYYDHCEKLWFPEECKYFQLGKQQVIGDCQCKKSGECQKDKGKCNKN